MSSSQKHIIGSCNWMTYFDSKANAFQLQSEISKWSKYQMLNEINIVLDEMCPSDRNMVIDSLELDIGVLNYYNLHNELPVKFSESLRDSIRSLINSSIDNQSKLKIVEQHHTYFDLIQNFLEFGYFPSNKETSKSLHQILDYLFTNHRIDTITLIKFLAKNENIRKRIAWQFKEQTIKKIVQELAPNNYEYIIGFSEKLIKVQQTEAVIQTSLSEFKKNLWLWIFNYLFVERGTLFNKVAFVKSTLLQMAQHFNLEYNVLFELIEMAVSEVRDNETNEFISILKIIFNQKDDKIYTKKATKKQTEKYWTDLETLLKDQSTRSLSHRKRYFNELLVNLYGTNKLRFRKLLSNIGSKEKDWVTIVSDLKKPAIEVVFLAIEPAKGEEILIEISALEKLNIKESFNISKDRLFSIALSYTSQLKSNSYSRKTFLNYIIKSLKSDDIDFKEVFLNTFFTSSFKGEKNGETLKTIHELGVLYEEELSKKITSFSEKAFIDLLTEKTSLTNQKKILFWLKTYPDSVFNILRQEHKYFNSLASKIDSKQLETFFTNTHKEYASAVDRIKKAINNLDKVETKNTIYSKFKQVFDTAIFNALKANKNASKIDFIFSLIDNLLWATTLNLDSQDPFKSGRRVLAHAQLKMLKLTQEESLELVNYRNQLKKKTVFQVLIEELKKDNRTKTAIMKRLSSLIHSRNVTLDELQKQEKLIINYVFQKQHITKKKLINDYKNKIQNLYSSINLHEVNKALEELYWKSLSQYTTHKGNYTKWLEIYDQAVFYKFFKAQENQKLILIEKDKDLFKNKNITKSLEEFPEEVKEQILKSKKSKTLIAFLKKEISVKKFNALISPAISNNLKNYFEASLIIFQTIENLETQKNLNILTDYFWSYLIDLIQGKNPEKLLRRFIDEMIEVLSLNPKFDKDFLVEEFVKKGIHKFIHVDYEKETVSELNISEDLKACIAKKKVDVLVSFLIINNEIPAWFDHQKSYSQTSLLNEIITTQPQYIIRFLRKDKKHINQFLKLSTPSKIIKSIARLYVNQSSLLQKIEKLYTLLGTISIQGLSGKKMQDILMKKILLSWITSKWNLISESNVWKEILWELNKHHKITEEEFCNGLDVIRTSLPETLQTTLNYTKRKNRKEVLKKNTQPFMLQKGIYVPNAGLVLLNIYFKTLFNRLNLIADNQFVSSEAQLRAIHYLQFIVTGLTKTEEHLLILNKILCGLDPTTPIKEEIEIPKEEKELITGMIESSITHWSSIGKNSIDGFRGNWLVRDGILREEEDRWELTVEKRGYDILMLKSPFSFSIIKMQWMKKPLHVKWQF